MHLVGGLPADLPASLFVVLHVPPNGSSVLPDILSRRGPLPALHPDDNAPILPGRIYVAPPNHHLLLKEGTVRVTRGPNENGHRPAIDPLFRSAARFYGPRAVGVILSGMLDDGTAGLQAIKQMGGTAIVQDPDEALFGGMPRSAVENVAIDLVLPLAEIAPAVARLAHEEAPERNGSAMPAKIDAELQIAEHGEQGNPSLHIGTPSSYACPECHGVLWEHKDGVYLRFRCRVGHAFSPDTLLAEQANALEDALWTALRALEENAALARRLCARAQERGHSLAASRFEVQAAEASQRAEIVRQALLRGQVLAAESGAGGEASPAGA